MFTLNVEESVIQMVSVGETGTEVFMMSVGETLIPKCLWSVLERHWYPSGYSQCWRE